jgi:hypothetical protein
MGDNGRVISSDEAKAVKAVAKTTDRSLEVVQQFGGFISKVLGTVPEDAVGFLIGDWLHHVRVRNFARLNARTDEILAARGKAAEIEPVPPVLAIPIIAAAQDESRPEIQELWARLLANGMDKSRPGIRQSFIETLKQFDPADALVFEYLSKRGTVRFETEFINNASSVTKLPPDEVIISVDRLKTLGCLQQSGAEISMPPYGRQFLNACSA